MSAASLSRDYVPVKGLGGWLKLTDVGWRYYAPAEATRAEPIGDPLRCMVLTQAEVTRYFGPGARFDGWEVVTREVSAVAA